MTTITFDTHAFVKRLMSVGMPEAQAEILADEQTKLIENRLATKEDMIHLEQSMANRIDAMEMRMTIKLGALIAAGVMFLSATKFFGH